MVHFEEDWKYIKLKKLLYCESSTDESVFVFKNVFGGETIYTEFAKLLFSWVYKFLVFIFFFITKTFFVWQVNLVFFLGLIIVGGKLKNIIENFVNYAEKGRLYIFEKLKKIIKKRGVAYYRRSIRDITAYTTNKINFLLKERF